MSSTERNRHDLINQMERLYLDRAWSDQEMADRVGTGRENVWKIRTKVMELKMGIPFFTENGRHRIDRTAYVANIKLTPSETLALYIGGRRLQQHTKTGQKDVANALEKLANALHKPLVAKMVQAAKQVLDQEQDEQQAKNLQGIMAGWMTGRRLRLKHRVPHANVTREYVVTPLQLEPAVWGDGVYLIGYSDYHQGIATFKLSRIERVTVTTEPFEQDAEFDSHALLHHAWGIWHSDNDPVTVRLQFTPYVTPYVKETIWHPEQTIQDLPDGGCIWQAEVAQPREMLPWIRGWGSDVEVLEPDWVAKTVKEHAQRLAKMYQIESTEDSANGRLQLLWGKTSKTSSDYHPAIYHMLDVAHIAQQMLSSQANPRWRNVLATALNVPPESLIEWLPWLIALHDIGKISVPFQALNEFHRSRLEQEGFDFGKYGTEYKMHHTIVGRIVLEPWAKETFGKNRAWRHIFLDMVAGHHGKYQSGDSTAERQWKSLKEDEQWAKLRTEAIELLRRLLLINLPTTWSNPQNLSAAIVALNGFTILCDWLGSDEQYFSPRPFMPPTEYIGHSKSKARARVVDAGFFVPTLSQAPTDFKALFSGWEPRPLQTAVAQIHDNILAAPTLTIIESLTGEGKTEAALTLAHRIGRLRQTDELYIALPTTATSNAMFKRLQTHLRDNLHLDAKVSLIHGQAFLVEDDLRIEPLSNEDGEQLASLEWFAPKKRALLAPFGVGTVDQAELAALNVKHNALRLIGLAGKVVILDEVHAYDTYMTTIIQAMLEWLSALGASVILLSATLPLSKRRELIQAYTGVEPTNPQNEAYPYLLTTFLTKSGIDSSSRLADTPLLVMLGVKYRRFIGVILLIGFIRNSDLAISLPIYISNLPEQASE